MKQIAYFHGNYANDNTAAMAKAMVRVFEAFGYEVRVPEQPISGTMFANGMIPDAKCASWFNIETRGEHVKRGTSSVRVPSVR